jgi:hypothetical protein
MKSGYYSADQIYFLFQDIFQYRRTVQFHIIRGAEIPPGAERMVVLARWTYRRGSSRDLTTEISFDLARRSGVWCLQEIKEML